MRSTGTPTHLRPHLLDQMEIKVDAILKFFSNILFVVTRSILGTLFNRLLGSIVRPLLLPITVAILLLLLGVVVMAFIAPNAAKAQGVQVYQLRNGMQVAYVQDTTRRLTHLGLTLRGGASLNPQDKAGMSHFFEHHFFGGLDSAAGSPSGVLRKVGMISTTSTYTEHQTFTISMPPARTVDGLSALASSLTSVLQREPLQERILADIAMELQSLEESPAYYLMAGIQNRLWKQVESSKDPTGRYAQIKNIDLGVLQRAYSAYLHPGNCLLSATGPSGADRFFHLADSLLGTWRPASAGAGLPGLTVKPLQESVYFIEENEYSARPLLVIAWPVPGSRSSADDTRLASAFAAVARMHGSIFHRELTRPGKADAIWWEFEGGYNPGQIVLRIAPKQDSVQACLLAVSKALHEIGHQADLLGSKEVITAAEKQAALEAAMGWDRSATRLDMLGRRWAAMEPSWANIKPFPMPTVETLREFALNHLIDKPHVAGLLINTLDARLAEAQFKEQHYTPVASVSNIEPATQLDPATDTIEATVIAAPMEKDPLEQFKEALEPLRILFKGMTNEPETSSEDVIREVASLCRKHPEQKLYVNGFSDGVGDGVTNYKLSIQRAMAVQKLMVEQYNIPAERLIINPFGEAFPEFPDNSNANRHRNRRVTFSPAPADAHPRTFLF